MDTQTIMNPYREIELDIALNAGYFIATGEISVADSRTLINEEIPKWAREFYEKYKLHKYSPMDDYMIRIDNFSEKKLFGQYRRRRGRGKK